MRFNWYSGPCGEAARLDREDRESSAWVLKGKVFEYFTLRSLNILVSPSGTIAAEDIYGFWERAQDNLAYVAKFGGTGGVR